MDIRRTGLFITGLIPTVLVLLDKDPVNPSGQWALIYLLLTTSVTVGQKLLKIPAAKYRRQLGLWAMWFVMLHVSNYIIEGGISKALTEISFDYQLVGWVTFLMMLALTLTSNTWAQKKLRAGWAKLHVLSYVIIGMGIIHGVIATKLGWFTMWPFAVIAVVVFAFKKPKPIWLAVSGVALAYVLVAVPNATPPSAPIVQENVVIEITNDIVSKSCVNGKELVYMGDGTRTHTQPCLEDESVYEIWDGFLPSDLVTTGVH